MSAASDRSTASELYRADLAFVHAEGFGGHAAGAAAEIVRRLRAGSRTTDTVVDVGCGAGVISRALVDARFRAVGFDPSEALLARARNLVPEALFECASAYDLALPPCCAVVAVGEVLGYHRPGVDADRLVQRFFERAAAALTADGQLIFDLIVAGTPGLDARGWRSDERWAVLVETVERPGERRLERRIETFVDEDGLFRRSRELHDVRVFEEAELLGWLDAAGFDAESAAAYGAHALAPRRRAFFARRRDR